MWNLAIDKTCFQNMCCLFVQSISRPRVTYLNKVNVQFVHCWVYIWNTYSFIYNPESKHAVKDFTLDIFTQLLRRT